MFVETRVKVPDTTGEETQTENPDRNPPVCRRTHLRGFWVPHRFTVDTPSSTLYAYFVPVHPTPQMGVRVFQEVLRLLWSHISLPSPDPSTLP